MTVKETMEKMVEVLDKSGVKAKLENEKIEFITNCQTMFGSMALPFTIWHDGVFKMKVVLTLVGKTPEELDGAKENFLKVLESRCDECEVKSDEACAKCYLNQLSLEGDNLILTYPDDDLGDPWLFGVRVMQFQSQGPNFMITYFQHSQLPPLQESDGGIVVEEAPEGFKGGNGPPS